MIKLIHLEFYKIKGKKICLSILLLIVFELMWSLWAATSYHDPSDGWRYLLYQMPSMNTLFMPILIAILASRLSDNEHKGNTFPLLNTLVLPSKLYIAKFICGSVYVSITAFIQVLCMFFINFLLHFTEPVPVKHIFIFLMSTMIVNLCLLALYQALSMIIVNQVIVLISGIVGGFIGFFSLFFPPFIQLFFLPSYYSLLDTIFPIMDMENKTFSMVYDTVNLYHVGIIITVGIFLIIIGQISFSRKEF